MKAGSLFFLFTLISFWSWSQERYWSNARLNASDFHAQAFPATPFQVKYDLVVSPYKEKIGKTKHSHYRANAVMYKAESWIAADSLQELRLRYANVIFDFAEYYSRRLEEEINISNSQGKLAEWKRTLDNEIGRIAIDTRYGTASDRIIFWENYIDNLLRETFRKDVPDYKYERFSIGYYWGATTHQFTGLIGQTFSDPYCVTNGAYFTWKRVYYGFQLAFPGRSVPSSAYYSEKYQFPATATFKASYQHFNIGYEIIRKPRFIVTPFVGLTTLRFIRTDVPKKPGEYSDPLKGSPNAGMAIDFRSVEFFINNSYQFRYGLTLRGSYSPVKYAPKLIGNCLSFTVGISLYMDAIKNHL